MSIRRHQRGVRQLGGFAGGTSRLARPPAVLPEPDIRPGGDVCVITIHAASTGNTYSPPRAAVSLDEAGMDNPCGLTVTFDPLGAVPDARALIPPGDYSGATATIQWGDGASAECYLAVETSGGATIVDDIDTGTSGIGLSVGAFTVSAPHARVYIFADFTVAGGSHTIDPATVITITKTG